MSQDNVYEGWNPSTFNRAWAFRLASSACRLLPRGALYVAAENLFDWHQAWKPETTAAVADNLSKAFPEWPRTRAEALAYQTITTYGLSMVDYFRSSFEPATVRPHDEEAERAFAAQGGHIIVTAHLGSWEVGGAHIGRSYRRHWVVSYPEMDTGVGDFREAQRQSSGQDTITAGRDSLTPFRLRRALESGENVIVLVDRALRKDRVPVTFRGRPTYFLRSPALFSALADAPVVPVAVMRDGPGLYTGYSGPPAVARPGEEGAREAMQRVADFFSRILEQYPDQWYNFFRYWQEAP